MGGISKAAREDAERLRVEGLKRCVHCGEVRSLDNFWAEKRASDGRASRCRDCSRAASNANVDRHRARWATGDPYANPTAKRCSTCTQLYPRPSFARCRTTPDGLSQDCRSCKSSKDAASQAKRRARWDTEDPYAIGGDKTCPRCSQTFDRGHFQRNRNTPDGLSAWCPACVAAGNSALMDTYRHHWAGNDRDADTRPKTCGRCRQVRPRADFSYSVRTADGLRGRCRGCHAAAQSAREAKKRGQWVEHVDRAVLWDRDGGDCYLCGDPVDPGRWDMEHINPIDNGGEHSYANTAVSHPSCNYSKGPKVWPDVSFDPFAVLVDSAPTYLKGVLLVHLPDGTVRLGAEVISAADALDLEAEPVVPDVDEAA